MHHKVDKRFKNIICRIIPPNSTERERTLSWFDTLAEKYKVNIAACCVGNFPESKCIDGELLQKTHALTIPANLKQPRNRPQCGCTHSIDIGGWPPKICFTGCLYCYSRPYLDKY
jgi:hypothetical protein